MKFGDNKIMLGGFVFLFCACFVKINYHFDMPETVYQYYAGSILFFSSTLMTEMAAIAILAKCISPKLKLGFWNAGLFSGTADTFGRSVGNALFTLYSLNAASPKHPEPMYAYIVNASVTLVIIMLTIIFLGKLKKHMEIHIEEV